MNRKKVYIFSSKIDVLALKSIIESEFDIESFSDYDNFLHALLSKDPSVVAVIISFFNVFNSKDEININNLKEILDVPYIVTVPSHGPLMKRAMSKGAYSLITIPYIPSSVKSVLTTSVNKYELAKVKKENEELSKSVSRDAYNKGLLQNIKGSIALIEVTKKGELKSIFINDDFYINNEVVSYDQINEFKNDLTFNIVEEDKKKVKDAFLDYINSDSTDLQISYKTKNNAGEISYISLVGKLAKYPFTDNPTILCTFYNYTRTAHLELESSSSKYELVSIVNNIPGGLVAYSHNGIRTFFIYASENFYNTFNLTKETFEKDYSSSLRNLVDPSSLNVYNKLVDDIISKNESSQAHITLRKNDKLQEYLVKTFRIDYEDKPSFYYFMIIDISDFIDASKKFKEANLNYSYALTHDMLTGLYNRKEFVRLSKLELENNPSTDYALIRLNIVDFKKINVSYGYDIGDLVIKKIASYFIDDTYRSDSIIARLNSDHFAILVKSQKMLTKVPQGITTIALSSKLTINISLSMGVYRIKDHNEKIEAIIDKANFAMMANKNKSSSSVMYYSQELEKEHNKRLEMISKVIPALENNEFNVFLQPIYSAKDKSVIGAEALVRWIDKDSNIVPPSLFIPILEEENLISRLDIYMINKVCEYIKSRQKRGLKDIPISVNLSRVTFINVKLIDKIIEIVDSFDIPHNLLRLELTESAYVENLSILIDTVKRLKNLGFVVLMDDFGSGYSSLSSIKNIPVNSIKLDMSLIKNLNKNDEASNYLVKVTIRYAKLLGLNTVAEGVETKEQLDFLQYAGCDYIQGYYYSKPLSIKDFERL